MPILWSSSLETGIRKVDLQHQELIELINDLETAHKSGRDAMALAEVLPRLTAYVLFHFNEEETITSLVANGTAHCEQHLAEHRQFKDLITKLKFDEPDNMSLAVAELITYLQTWLIEHIMVTDKQLAVIYHAHQRLTKTH